MYKRQIVGSGAGGAILAMELAKSNVPVTIIEKGKYIDSKDAFNYYDKYNGCLLYTSLNPQS